MGMDIKKLEEQIRELPIEGQGAKRDLLPLYADSEAVDALRAPKETCFPCTRTARLSTR